MNYEETKALLKDYSKITGCYHWVQSHEHDGHKVRLMYERSLNDSGELEQFSSIDELENTIKDRLEGRD